MSLVEAPLHPREHTPVFPWRPETFPIQRLRQFVPLLLVTGSLLVFEFSMEKPFVFEFYIGASLLLLVMSPATPLGPPLLWPCDPRSRVMLGDVCLAGPGRGLRRAAFRSLKVQTVSPSVGGGRLEHSKQSLSHALGAGVGCGGPSCPARGSPHLAGGRVNASVHPQGLCTCQEHSPCASLLEHQPPGTPAS